MSRAPSIARQVAALDQATTEDLMKQYARLHCKPARSRNRAWLIKRVAWALQAEAFGGLSKAATKRLDELIAQVGGALADPSRTVTATLPRRSKPDAPPIGTTLTRQWHRQQVIVHVRDNGFEHDGVLYRSLTAVAAEVTGSHWNGRLFFGLVDRKKKAS